MPDALDSSNSRREPHIASNGYAFAAASANGFSAALPDSNFNSNFNMNVNKSSSPAQGTSPVTPGSPLWEQILDSVSLGVAVLEGREGHTLWTNTALRRLLLAGVGLGDVLQWQPHEYLPNLELDTWHTILQRVVGNVGGEAGSDFGRLQFVHHATRNIAYWEWNLQKMPGASADAPCLLLTVQNVTDVVMNERQLATAVRTAQQARRDAESLGTLAQRVNQSLTTPDLLRTITQEAARYFDTEHAAVLLLSPDARQFQVGYGIGLHGVSNLTSGVPLTGVGATAFPGAKCGNTPADKAIAERITLVTSGALAPDMELPLLSNGKRPATLICSPIRQNDRIFGAVEVYFPEARDIPDASVALLTAIADQAAVSLVKADLYEQIAVQRRQLQSIFDNAPVGILYFNADGVAATANAAIARSYGQSVEEILGRHGTELMPGLPGRVFEMAQEGTPFHASHVVFARAVGEEVIYDVSLIPVQSDNGLSGLLLLLFEVTELVAARQEADAARKDAEDALTSVRAAQSQMVQMEKMRAVGELAQGVAHDINNALMAVLGYTELAEDDLEEPEALANHLATIKKAALDASSTVQRLNRFAKRGIVTHADQTDINEVVTDVVQMTRPRWRDAAQKEGRVYKVETQLAELPPILGDPSGLREVLMNMIHNALNAMPEGGSLTLSTRTTVDKQVEIEIADTGLGMTPEVMNRIFEAFFTTRGVEGTGLGLAMSWGIIQRHGGTIDVESEPGKGTRFFIRLPLSLTERREAAPVTPVAAPADAPGTPILVVDDEPMIAGVLSSILGRHGYRVTLVNSGQEALEKLRAPGSDFQLVTTDHGMPGMNGLQLVAEIKRTHPHLPVLLLTGWGESVLQTNVPEAMPDAVLGKPINQADLLEALAKLMPQSRH